MCTGAAPVDGISGAVTHKEGVKPKVLLQRFISVRRNSQCPDMYQLGIKECLGIVDVVNQGMNQILWLCPAARADEDSIPSMDMREDLIF